MHTDSVDAAMEVAVEMVRVGNALNDEDVEEEDTDAVVVPDFFKQIRPLLCQSDGSPRLLVRIAPALVLYAFLAVAYFVRLRLNGSSGQPAPPLQQMYMTGWVVIFSLPGLFIPMLCHVIQKGGSLELLGVGKQRVSASSLKTAWKWVWVSRVVAIFPTLYGLLMISVFFKGLLGLVGVLSIEDDPGLKEDANESGLEVHEQLAVGLFVIPGVVFGCSGFAAMACFFGSLKVAVCLARDDVLEVLRKTNRAALLDDKLWSADVARPAIALGTDTMKYLSDGWGSGTGVGFVLCWIVSFTNFLVVIHNIMNEAAGLEKASADEDPYDPTKHGLTCFGMAVAPLFITADVAHVSSTCDTLLNTINSLRLEWDNTDEANVVHSRTFPLQWTLKGLNNSQGLGFVVFSKVVDRKT